MEGVQRESKWKTLRERLGFKAFGCCGASWGPKPSDMAVRESEDEEEERAGPDQGQETEMEEQENEDEEAEAEQIGVEGVPDPGCVDDDPPASGMNLATALAAERQLRATQDLEGGNVEPTSNSDTVLETPAAMTGISSSVPGTPLTLRVSLMKLLEEEGDGVDGVGGDGNRDGEKGGGGEGTDGMCCVCMGRRKGAAFIPCGHTFCRVCSRELWVNRGSCPICNRSILEVLDIF